MAMSKNIPANPSGKPDMGSSKKPPMGMKPMAKAGNGNGNKGKPGTRKA
jgi:hypothetical protein